MNKCINLRFRSKKGIIYQYCIKQRREIPKNECEGCIYKEYKKYKHKITNKKRIKVSDETYKKVLCRDKQCRLCGSIKNLHLHHIDGRGKYLTNDINNCIMLCQNCHLNVVHKNLKKYRPILKEIINERNMERYKKL